MNDFRSLPDDGQEYFELHKRTLGQRRKTWEAFMSEFLPRRARSGHSLLHGYLWFGFKKPTRFKPKPRRLVACINAHMHLLYSVSLDNLIVLTMQQMDECTGLLLAYVLRFGPPDRHHEVREVELRLLRYLHRFLNEIIRVTDRENGTPWPGYDGIKRLFQLRLVLRDFLKVDLQLKRSEVHWVEDVDTLVDFYSGILQFDLLGDPHESHGRKWARVSKGKTKFLFVRKSESRYEDGFFQKQGWKLLLSDNVSVSYPSRLQLETAYHEAQRRGIPKTHVRWSTEGVCRFRVVDPNGWNLFLAAKGVPITWTIDKNRSL